MALAVPGDRNGGAARRTQSEVARGIHGAPVTTSFVLDEAATLIRMETDVAAASRFLHATLEARSVTVVWIDESDFLSATEMLERHKDTRWSFTDCTSLVVMKELGISSAFAFDHNFQEAGFSLTP